MLYISKLPNYKAELEIAGGHLPFSVHHRTTTHQIAICMDVMASNVQLQLVANGMKYYTCTLL